MAPSQWQSYAPRPMRPGSPGLQFAAPRMILALSRRRQASMSAGLGASPTGKSTTRTTNDDEHLRRKTTENPSIAAAFLEDAQMSAFDERLRCRPIEDDH